jgi:hypothetical protein
MMKPPACLASEKLPRIGRWVMVMTPLGSCLGFLDPEREWRDARNGTAIQNVQSWHLTDDGQTTQSGGEKDQAETLAGHL